MLRLTGRLLLTMAALGVPGAGYGQSGPRLPERDAVRIAEAFRVANRVRSDVWPGWEGTPMVVLLVSDSTEYLIGHPRPTDEFTSLGHDPVLDREVLVRARRYPPTLLATFPAVAGVSTIVVGSAARTGKSSSEWVMTLLHEHFHQWQTSLPAYYARVDGLGLTRGDTTGQWMLDYAFPYDSVPVQRAVKALAGSLVFGPPAAVAERRAALRRALSADDLRYLEFQLWQEGTARFVELAAADAAAEAGEPLERFQRLPDYTPYRELALQLRQELYRQLEELDLKRERRVAFYPIGAAIAFLLERTERGWKERYDEQLILGK